MRENQLLEGGKSEIFESESDVCFSKVEINLSKQIVDIPHKQASLGVGSGVGGESSHGDYMFWKT